MHEHLPAASSLPPLTAIYPTIVEHQHSGPLSTMLILTYLPTASILAHRSIRRSMEATAMSTKRAATPCTVTKTFALATATALVATTLTAVGFATTDAQSCDFVPVYRILS